MWIGSLAVLGFVCYFIAGAPSTADAYGPSSDAFLVAGTVFVAAAILGLVVQDAIRELRWRLRG